MLIFMAVLLVILSLLVLAVIAVVLWCIFTLKNMPIIVKIIIGILAGVMNWATVSAWITLIEML